MSDGVTRVGYVWRATREAGGLVPVTEERARELADAGERVTPNPYAGTGGGPRYRRGRRAHEVEAARRARESASASAMEQSEREAVELADSRRRRNKAARAKLMKARRDAQKGRSECW